MCYNILNPSYNMHVTTNAYFTENFDQLFTILQTIFIYTFKYEF